jgi:hypothetical protein
VTLGVGRARRLGTAGVIVTAASVWVHDSRTPLVNYSLHGANLLEYHARQLETAR